MDREILDKKLIAHKEWLDSKGKSGEQLSLQDTDLRNCCLKGAILTKADLVWVDLTGVNLLEADLRKANLEGAILQNALLQDANLYKANLTKANLYEADLRNAYLREANLWRADLREAYLEGTNLRGAKIDFSCWPLHCGSFDAKVDRYIAAQLAYHFCRLDCENPDFIEARNAIINFANQYSKVDECGKLVPIEKLFA